MPSTIPVSAGDPCHRTPASASQQHVSVLGERGLVADLEHLGIAVAPAGFEHERCRTGSTAYQRGDAELINRIGEIVTVRVLSVRSPSWYGPQAE